VGGTVSYAEKFAAKSLESGRGEQGLTFNPYPANVENRVSS